MLPVCHFSVNAPTKQRRAKQVEIDHPRILSQSLLEFLVGLDVVFQRRSLERSVSAHQRLGEAEV
jgi:hypothetical protein